MVTTGTNNILARVLGAAVLVIATLAGVGCGDIHARSEFTGLVMGKSEEEVVSKVGKPAAVDAGNPDRVTWTFNSTTFDVDNQNKRDSKTVVVFQRSAATGKLSVAEVSFK